MPVDPTPSQDEIDRQRDRHIRVLRTRGKVNVLVRYHNGAEAAAEAAGIP